VRATARRLLFEVLRGRGTNRIVRALRRPLTRALPPRVVRRIPVRGEVPVSLPGGRTLRLVTDGRDSIASALYWSGRDGFEPELLRLFFTLIENAGTVFDVGANTGLYGLIAALHDPARSVRAFEPHPSIYPRLVENARANGLENLVAEPLAVGDRDGRITLHLPSTLTLSLSASTLSGFRRTDRSMSVHCTTLDTYVRDRGLGRVDLLKLDTEATEPRVLAGARELVERDRPWIVCEVLRDRTEEALEAYFRDTDYAFYHVTDRGPVRMRRLVGDATHAFRNVLFVPGSRRDVLGGILREET
jgi:FkbM family methyltransferase